MRINISSVLVDDQEKALRFYTEVLGFVKKHDVPVSEDRWLTVVSPQDPDGTELLLAPSGHPQRGRGGTACLRAHRTGASESGGLGRVETPASVRNMLLLTA